ncbi:carbohydrate kinase family protein [Candidatus Berkelbacteria bacterium]|nr:carbohydrate kinase family protein [Candidatus Berkelbacteria bacterium]
MFDLISLGDTQHDTFLLLNEHEAHVVCKLNTKDCEICFNYADKIPVDSVHRAVAGNAANVAVSSSRLGLKTAIWTILGGDALGGEALEKFKREKINTSFVVTEKDTTSNVSTVINIFNERTILIYHHPRVYKVPELPEAKYYYITSMAPGSETVFEDCAQLAARNHTKLVFQPGTHQLRVGPAPARILLAHTEIIFMNVQEAQQYTNSQSADPSILLRSLHELGPRIAVVTDGKNGSYCYDGEKMRTTGIIDEAPVVEPTGAGDAYAAGFTAARIKGKSIDEAMQWGTYNASAVIGEIGPQAGLLTVEKIHEWEKRYPLSVERTIISN